MHSVLEDFKKNSRFRPKVQPGAVPLDMGVCAFGQWSYLWTLIFKIIVFENLGSFIFKNKYNYINIFILLHFLLLHSVKSLSESIPDKSESLGIL
jgi:hypothetical protein